MSGHDAFAEMLLARFKERGDEYALSYLAAMNEGLVEEMQARVGWQRAARLLRRRLDSTVDSTPTPTSPEASLRPVDERSSETGSEGAGKGGSC